MVAISSTAPSGLTPSFSPVATISADGAAVPWATIVLYIDVF